MAHALFRFPANAPDSLPQVLRLLSGAGRPGYYPVHGSGLWGVTWVGKPTRLVQKQSWIAVYYSGYVYGWLRYCHNETGSGNIADPVVSRAGTLLFGDRCVRFDNPIKFAPRTTRQCYLDATDLAHMPAPALNGGQPIVWVRGNKCICGCDQHP